MFTGFELLDVCFDSADAFDDIMPTSVERNRSDRNDVVQGLDDLDPLSSSTTSGQQKVVRVSRRGTDQMI